MPEWITPLLRVLVAMPTLGNCSTRKTSCQRFETASAIAQPMTPPLIIRMLAGSMKTEYRKVKKENRKIVCLGNRVPEDSSFLFWSKLLSYWSPPASSKKDLHATRRDSVPSCTA